MVAEGVRPYRDTRRNGGIQPSVRRAVIRIGGHNLGYGETGYRVRC